MRTFLRKHSESIEIFISFVAIFFTSVIALYVGRDTARTYRYFQANGTTWDIVEFCLFSGILLVLLYGCLVYLAARMFYFVRLREVRPDVVDNLDDQVIEYIINLGPSRWGNRHRG